VGLAFAGELRRLFSHPSPAIVLALPAIVAGLSVLGLWHETRANLADVAAGGLFSHSLVTAFEGVAVALRDALPVAALLFAGLASQSLAGELSRGTLRNLLLRPLGRPGLAMGKLLALLTATGAGYALLLIVAVAASALLFDFTDVVEILETDSAEPWVITEAKVLWPPFSRMLGAMVLPLMGYTALGFLVGAVARRGVTALGASVSLVVSLDLLRIPGQSFGFEAGLLSAYAPSPLRDTSRVAHLLDLIRAPNNPPGGFLDGSLLVPMVWIVVAAAVATFILSRRSVP
jgi:ABC-2 family transporter